MSKLTLSKMIILTVLLRATINTHTYQQFYLEEESFFQECFNSLAELRHGGEFNFGDNNTDYLKEEVKHVALSKLDKYFGGHLDINVLYAEALHLYGFASFYKDHINPYHNVCHGFMTMMIAADLYQEESTKAKKSEYDEKKHIEVAFAGLFHDVLHPGMGNKTIFSHQVLVDHYIAILKSEPTFGGAKFINDIGTKIKDLETVHANIAGALFHQHFNEAPSKFLLDSILHTNMFYHFSRLKIECGKDFKKLVHGYELLVHFADIGTNCMRNFNTVLFLGKLVLEEFAYESVFESSPGLCGTLSQVDLSKIKKPADVINAGNDKVIQGQAGFVQMFLVGMDKRDHDKCEHIIGIVEFLHNPLPVDAMQKIVDANKPSDKINLQSFFFYNAHKNLDRYKADEDKDFFKQLDIPGQLHYENVIKLCRNELSVSDKQHLVNIQTNLAESVTQRLIII